MLSFDFSRLVPAGLALDGVEDDGAGVAIHADPPSARSRRRIAERGARRLIADICSDERFMIAQCTGAIISRPALAFSIWLRQAGGRMELIVHGTKAQGTSGSRWRARSVTTSPG